MSLTREAFERIREAIVSGALEFGEQLSETQIAGALGMSKAPVRAAFIELKDKGLVNIVPQSGTYVFSPTAEDVRTLSHFRALLENEALREATKHRANELVAGLKQVVARMEQALAEKDWAAYGKADNAYHLAILEASGNSYLVRAHQISATALEALRARLQRGGFRERSFDEHVEMATLLATGKVGEAARLLRTHILVINDSLDLLPLTPSKVARKDYADVFRRSADSSALISRQSRGATERIDGPAVE
jgi:DNA-binding GntR family transcriptional regulator